MLYYSHNQHHSIATHRTGGLPCQLFCPGASTPRCQPFLLPTTNSTCLPCSSTSGSWPLVALLAMSSWAPMAKLSTSAVTNASRSSLPSGTRFSKTAITSLSSLAVATNPPVLLSSIVSVLLVPAPILLSSSPHSTIVALWIVPPSLLIIVPSPTIALCPFSSTICPPILPILISMPRLSPLWPSIPISLASRIALAISPNSRKSLPLSLLPSRSLRAALAFFSQLSLLGLWASWQLSLMSFPMLSVASSISLTRINEKRLSSFRNVSFSPTPPSLLSTASPASRLPSL